MFPARSAFKLRFGYDRFLVYGFKRFPCLLYALLASFVATVSPVSALAGPAEDRFDRGLSRMERRDYEGALQDFEAALRMRPRNVTRYNAAFVLNRLGRSVEALQRVKRLLARKDLGRTLRDQAQDLKRSAEKRVGQVLLPKLPAGSRVYVDGKLVPAAPRRLSLVIGKRFVTVIAKGMLPARREVVVHSTQEKQLDFELKSAEKELGKLRVECAVPSMSVYVDGEGAGKTPLEKPLLLRAGSREITIKREGYKRQRQSLKVESGAIATVTCAAAVDEAALPEQSSRLKVILAEGASLYVDGKKAPKGATVGASEGFLVPPGEHLVVVKKPGYYPWKRKRYVPAGRTEEVLVRLRPTPERLEEIHAVRGSYRLAGAITLGVGAALAVAGGVGTGIFGTQLNDAQKSLDQARDYDAADSTTPLPSYCEQHGASCDARINDYESDKSSATGLLIGSMVGLAVGAVAMVVGTSFLLSKGTGDDAHAKAQTPSLSLAIILPGTPGMQGAEDGGLFGIRGRF